MNRNLPAPLENLRPPPCINWPAEPEMDHAAPLFAHHLWPLKRHRWKILAFIAACQLAALVVSYRVTPIYEATAVIEIDRQAPSGVIGEEAARATANDSDLFLATQIRLIQTDAVLRPVALKYRLLEREQQFEDLPKLSAPQLETAPILLRQLTVSRQPGAYLLLIGYRSPDPYLASDVANAVANSYLQHTYNVRLRSAAHLASYMEKEIEGLKTKMESSAERLQAFERELNAINPDTRLGITQRVETAGPVVEAKTRFDRSNARSFEYQSLKREAESDKKVYDELVRKVEEASINASFQSSAIRVADAARPGLRPVFPRLGLNLMAALLLSAALGCCAAVLGDALDKTVREPELITRMWNIDVIGSLPLVKHWRARPSAIPLNGMGARTGLALVRAADGEDPQAGAYREAVRALRNSILLADFDRRVHSLLVTSPSPAEGKSTIAAHLALADAAQGRKTLLIDGDLRRPSVHRRFKISGAIGLSSVLVSHLPWRDAVLKLGGLPDLDILPAGPPSARAVELIGHRLAPLLDEAAREYDLIVLDAAPLLGFAEPIEIATAVDGVIVVTRAGETTRKAVALVLATLARLRANTLGIVLNEVRNDSSEGFYYYSSSPKYLRRYANRGPENRYTPQQ